MDPNEQFNMGVDTHLTPSNSEAEELIARYLVSPGIIFQESPNKTPTRAAPPNHRRPTDMWAHSPAVPCNLAWAGSYGYDGEHYLDDTMSNHSLTGGATYSDYSGAYGGGDSRAGSSSHSSSVQPNSRADSPWQMYLNTSPSTNPFQIMEDDDYPLDLALDDVGLGKFKVPNGGFERQELDQVSNYSSALSSPYLGHSRTDLLPLSERTREYFLTTNRRFALVGGESRPELGNTFQPLFQSVQGAPQDADGQQQQQHLYVSLSDLMAPPVSTPRPISLRDIDRDFQFQFVSPVNNSGHPGMVKRGLVGWSGSDKNLEQFTFSSHQNEQASSRKRPRSITPELSYPCSTNASSGYKVHDDKEREKGKRRRLRESPCRVKREFDLEFSDGDSDDSDAAYLPSRSPSLAPSVSVSLTNTEGDVRKGDAEAAHDVRRSKKTKTKGKSKMKGSAAHALAVALQIKAQRSESGDGETNGRLSSSEGSEKDKKDSSTDDTGESKVDSEQIGTSRTRQRRNAHIPLPIPIPNLIKKSRGRKVPYVANTKTGGDDEGSVDDEGSRNTLTRDATVMRGRRGVKVTVDGQGGGKRVYVCVVTGCGKCFVRGEHLKRHVRSIHTHDKPHPCPFEGCDKTFSRRDNLGQHVRIHLQ